MSYATYADIVAKVPPTTDLSGLQDFVDTQIAAEEAYVDGRLAVRYEVPIDEVSSPQFYALVKSIVVDLVVSRVKLHAQEAEGSEEAGWYANQIRTAALERLDQLCSGALAPEGYDEKDATLPTDGLTDDTASTPFFTRAMER